MRSAPIGYVVARVAQRSRLRLDALVCAQEPRTTAPDDAQSRGQPVLSQRRAWAQHGHADPSRAAFPTHASTFAIA